MGAMDGIWRSGLLALCFPLSPTARGALTMPVSDVERALRFYVDHVGFALEVDYSPNARSASCSSLHPAPAARSR